MRTMDQAFQKRLARLDPQLTLRWMPARGEWDVQRFGLVNDTSINPDSARDLYDWNRGRFRACCLREVGGVLVASREWREVPQHLFWWPGPLGGGLIETLRRLSVQSYGSATEAWDQTIGAQWRKEAQAEAATYGELKEVRRDVKQQIRRAEGQEVFIGQATQ